MCIILWRATLISLLIRLYVLKIRAWSEEVKKEGMVLFTSSDKSSIQQKRRCMKCWEMISVSGEQQFWQHWDFPTEGNCIYSTAALKNSCELCVVTFWGSGRAGKGLLLPKKKKNCAQGAEKRKTVLLQLYVKRALRLYVRMVVYSTWFSETPEREKEDKRDWMIHPEL